GPSNASPQRCVAELIGEALRVLDAAVPEVPDIVRDPPHLRVLAHFAGFFDWRGTRGETEHHGAAGFAQRRAEHANLVAPVGTAADAIHFDEVHAPGRVELRDGIVVGLGAGSFGADAVVVRIPRAGFRSVGRIGSTIGRAGDREVRLDGFLRNAAQDVN